LYDSNNDLLSTFLITLRKYAYGQAFATLHFNQETKINTLQFLITIFFEMAGTSLLAPVDESDAIFAFHVNNVSIVVTKVGKWTGCQSSLVSFLRCLYLQLM
jgi:hypothetical protein